MVRAYTCIHTTAEPHPNLTYQLITSIPQNPAACSHKQHLCKSKIDDIACKGIHDWIAFYSKSTLQPFPSQYQVKYIEQYQPDNAKKEHCTIVIFHEPVTPTVTPPTAFKPAHSAGLKGVLFSILSHLR